MSSSNEAGVVLVDGRPLQGPSALRGIGTYVRGLLGGLLEEGFGDRLAVLLDAGLPAPDLPGRPRVELVRRRYHGRLAPYEDAAALGADLARLRPVLYHATTLSLPGSSPCPLAVTLHDLIPWVFGGWRMAGERMRFWLAPRLLRRADAVLAVSHATAQDAVRLAGVDEARIEVIPEAAGPAFRPRQGAADRVRERFRVEAPYLIYVGALDARKDPAGLLRAWRSARAAGVPVSLVLAGSAGAQAPAAMDGARQLGHVSDDQLADLLSAAACLVFPSRYEGFGLPLLEAMACGCPVVAYRNSSLPEVAGDAATLVADGDAEALGREVASLVQDDRRRRRAAKAGLAQAARFSWRGTARATIAAYSRLLR
jgi:glycosyltransferase involved in cell wall biosynthesis